MPAKYEPVRIPDHLVTIEKRADGAIIVRVRSESVHEMPLPDAVFAFRCGDPQYEYWMSRLATVPPA